MRFRVLGGGGGGVPLKFEEAANSWSGAGHAGGSLRSERIPGPIPAHEFWIGPVVDRA